MGMVALFLGAALTAFAGAFFVQRWTKDNPQGDQQQAQNPIQGLRFFGFLMLAGAIISVVGPLVSTPR